MHVVHRNTFEGNGYVDKKNNHMNRYVTTTHAQNTRYQKTLGGNNII